MILYFVMVPYSDLFKFILNTGVIPGRRCIDQALVNGTRWVDHHHNVEFSSLRYSDPSRCPLIRHLCFKISRIPIGVHRDLTLLWKWESRPAGHASMLHFVPTSTRLSELVVFSQAYALSMIMWERLEDKTSSATSWILPALRCNDVSCSRNQMWDIYLRFDVPYTDLLILSLKKSNENRRLFGPH